MNVHSLILRSCFTCDMHGNILTILKDDLEIFTGKTRPISFSELFAAHGLECAQQFWRVLLEQSTVFSWDVPVSILSLKRNMKLTGVVGSTEITLVLSNEGTQEIYVHSDPLSKNDDSAPTLDLAPNDVALNKISQLNNELVNLHRRMVKQNHLIETLSRKLETNDQKFQLLSRAINDAIWDWNIVEDTIQWNQRLSAIYGYSESQFPKTLEAWAANIHPDDRAEAMATLEKTIANGSLNWKFLYRYKSLNGTYKYTFDRGFIVYFGNQAIRMISVMQDIDERMASLQEIEKLSLVASKTDNLVIITDAEEKIEWVNESFIKKTGYTLNEVIGKTPRFMQGLETDRLALDTIRKHLNASQSVTQEILNYTKDGTKFWVRVNINPVFDDRNKLVKFVAVETDVTPHKDYENKITTIAADLRNLIATVNAPVFGIDRNGFINEWNNLACDLTGYNKSEILGKNLAETIVDQDSQGEINEILTSVFSGHPLGNIELPIVSNRGKKIIILINATPRKNTQGEVESVFLVGQDITELTKYRQSLEEKVKERTEDLEIALKKEKELVSIKSRFASMVSHEFRTPLSTIRLSANHIKRYRSRLHPEEIDLKLETIHDQVAHMTHMLEDVLTLGKSDAGKIEVDKKKLNIIEFIHTIKNEVENQFKNTHTIHCTLNVVRPEIASDTDLLRNIFVNLLSNAIKFSPGKSDVYLTASEFESAVIFEIKDEGIGIPAGDTHRIFNPFDRGTNTTSIPGTGLGLSIVKKAIELVHGEIKFHSTSQGTTFIITLPKDNVS